MSEDYCQLVFPSSAFGQQALVDIAFMRRCSVLVAALNRQTSNNEAAWLVTESLKNVRTLIFTN